MKPIKFRAWDTEEKRWWPKGHDEWINIAHDGTIIYGDSDGDPEDAEGRFEIIQFTGLLDKNGREIYEGDLLQDIDSKEVGEVIWDEQDLCYTVKFSDNSKWGFVSLKGKDNHCEVIGRRFEDPDLLK